MKGVHFVVDDAGNQRAVLIDLKINRRLWEDFYDTAIARDRVNERRETIDDVRRKVLGDQT